MRKKEVRWISRDDDGLYMQWRAKPQWRTGVKEYTGKKYISHSATMIDELEIGLKRGGLAKVTIERQY